MSVLTKEYDREEYLSFLEGRLDLTRFPKEQKVSGDKLQELYELGIIKTADSKELPVYEVRIKPQTRIERNRAGLRNAIMRQIQGTCNDGALASFIDPHKAEVWRLTFMSIERKDVAGRLKETQTDECRYTFLLGPGAQTRVPANRLMKLSRNAKLEDLREAFAVEPLNKEFYKELSRWYKEAKKKSIFPNGTEKSSDKDHVNSLIRFITRLLFVWFLKEKSLVEKDLFNLEYIKQIIHYEKPSSYYKAILQNLFFATLNQEICDRGFHVEGRDSEVPAASYQYGQDSKCPIFRIENDRVEELFSRTPFLNGGLFECLDLPFSDSPPPPC